MKHPNKKVEAIRKEYAWALMSRKRIAKHFALIESRRVGKTVSVELNDL